MTPINVSCQQKHISDCFVTSDGIHLTRTLLTSRIQLVFFFFQNKRNSKIFQCILGLSLPFQAGWDSRKSGSVTLNERSWERSDEASFISHCTWGASLKSILSPMFSYIKCQSCLYGRLTSLEDLMATFKTSLCNYVSFSLVPFCYLG